MTFNKYTFLSYLVLFGLWSSILMPNISFGVIGFYLVTPISILVLIVILTFSIPLGGVVFEYLFIIIFLLCLVVLFSSLYSWLRGVSPVSYRDLMEIVKYLQFLPYILAISFLKIRFKTDFEISAKWATGIFVFLGVLQALNFHFFTRLYLDSSSPHLQSVLDGYRLNITGSDPNIGGVLAVFFAFLSISFFALRKNFIWLLSFVMCFVLLLLTQSRTSLVAFGVALFFYILMYYKVSLHIKIFLLVFIAVEGYLIFNSLDLKYIILGFELAAQGDNVSLNVRFENIEAAYWLFVNNPMLGVGPSKESISSVIDSEYALILQRYGVFGAINFSMLIIYLFFVAKNSTNSVASRTLLLFMIITPIVMVTNNIYSGYQLMSIPVLLYIAVKVRGPYP